MVRPLLGLALVAPSPVGFPLLANLLMDVFRATGQTKALRARDIRRFERALLSSGSGVCCEADSVVEGFKDHHSSLQVHSCLEFTDKEEKMKAKPRMKRQRRVGISKSSSFSF